jgi:Asp-tRNA(Asn)/Glu-tRNA(Gln) amidotransferase A subunit family amidase
MNIKELFNEAFANCGITSIFNLLGLPALTIDFMKNKGSEEFCPVMIVGNYFEDHRVLQFARYVETLVEKNI